MRTSTSNKTSKKTNKWMSESAHSDNIVNISLDNTNQSSIKNVLRQPLMIVCLIITYFIDNEIEYRNFVHENNYN